MDKQSYKLIPPLTEATFLEADHRISDGDYSNPDNDPMRHQDGTVEDYLVDDVITGGQYIMLKDDFEDMYEITHYVLRT